jgi:hypothetical protein
LTDLSGYAKKSTANGDTRSGLRLRQEQGQQQVLIHARECAIGNVRFCRVEYGSRGAPDNPCCPQRVRKKSGNVTDRPCATIGSDSTFALASTGIQCRPVMTSDSQQALANYPRNV